MSRHRLRDLALGLVSLLCLGFTGWVAYSLVFQPQLYEAPIGGPFALTDAAGDRRSDADFRGRYLLIAFGYTSCPDVCPTRLSEMTEALDAFEAAAPARAGRVTPVFITIDPERDTPDVLAAYVAHFHPRFVALTGSAEEIAAAAGAYRAYYRRAPGEAEGDYLMDHSSLVYLTGPDGRYLSHFDAKTDGARLSGRLAELVK